MVVVVVMGRIGGGRYDRKCCFKALFFHFGQFIPALPLLITHTSRVTFRVWVSQVRKVFTNTVHE